MNIDIKKYITDLNENLDDHLDNGDFNDDIDEERLNQIKRIIDKAPTELMNELFLGQRRILRPDEVNPEHCEYHEVNKKDIIDHKLKCLQVERIRQMKAERMKKNNEQDKETQDTEKRESNLS